MIVSRPRSPPQRELASSPSLEPADLKQGLCQRRALDHGFDALLACAACRGPIRERFYLQALDQPWHTGCLRCSLCGTGLDSQASCFAREGRIYCRDDYLRAFVRCCACGAALSPRDLVMRVRGGLAFHVSCFRCASCLCPLLKGDVYGMRDNSVFCKLHFQDTAESERNRNKRMRTSFKHSQLRAMKAYFTVNHNPDSKDLKQLSLRTGLSKRVLQVWFQNARAKWRRNLLRQASHGPEIAQDSSPLQDLGATITLEEQTIHSYANLF
nr:LIM/homeobox protein Awh-like [Rhipicephalus microplus]